MYPALIDRNCLGVRRVTGNNARHERFSDAQRLKSRESPNAFGLRDRFSLLCKLYLEIVVLTLKPQIFLMNADQHDVAVPGLAHPKERPIRKFFQRSQRVEGPHSNETRIDPA